MYSSVVVIIALLIPLIAHAADRDHQVEAAQKLYNSGAYTEARDALLKGDWKNDGNACLLLFHCETKLGNFKEAKEYYKAAANADPSAKVTIQAIEKKREEMSNSAKERFKKERIAQQNHRETMAISRANAAAAATAVDRQLAAQKVRSIGSAANAASGGSGRSSGSAPSSRPARRS